MKLRVMTGYFSILALYAWDSGKCYWEGVRISYRKTAVWAKFGFFYGIERILRWRRTLKTQRKIDWNECYRKRWSAGNLSLLPYVNRMPEYMISSSTFFGDWSIVWKWAFSYSRNWNLTGEIAWKCSTLSEFSFELTRTSMENLSFTSWKPT